MKTVLRLTGKQHESLHSHLFPGDGNEAVALALCGRRSSAERHILTLHRIVPIPHDRCMVRTPQCITWPTDMLPELLQEAHQRNFALLKIHSHPGSWPQFSETDDASDRELFPSICSWVDDGHPHVSAVMLPDGSIFGRAVDSEGSFTPLSSISVAGEDIRFFKMGTRPDVVPDFALRHAQVFGSGTTVLLQRLSIAVVGCSGTGSPVVEMLTRLGVGELVLVDPDRLEPKNQNRIVNAMERETNEQWFKVDLLADAIDRMGLGTRVVPLARDLFDPEVVQRVAECDIVIGCMDTVDGRNLLNRIATFYLIPYFDIGVHLNADGKGGVDQICGTVHYLQPDGSSLLSRGLYTPEQLQAAGLFRTNPAEYEKQRNEKYITGVQEDRPAVISVNFLYAALAVNELLARLHSYRDDGNAEFARYQFSLTQARLINEPDGEPCRVLRNSVGRGDMRPLLNLPELSIRQITT